ncbi:MAG TPA: NADH-quinone oxidoreductase subunit M [Planctomycetota bacterium]|nr:NADH-quinone oxidoreductase subunit M [Planctomycetota bacterium]
MLLVLLIVAPLIAAGLVCLGAGREDAAARRLGLVFSAAIAALGLPLLWQGDSAIVHDWFRLWGTDASVRFHLASDGLSAWLIQLVTFLTPIAILATRSRVRDMAVCALVMESLMIGALLARDLVPFYVFYEGMLVPMVVMVAGMGGRDRRGAALQFFLYTMLGGALMLVGIWYIAWKLGTTDLATVAANIGQLPANARLALFASFCLAFAVKVPLPPLHGWQARVYAEAPAGAAVLLAGAMAKVGVYGFLRLVLPLFPAESAQYASWFIALGLVAVVAGALMAMVQVDAKRLVAYSSLSHLGLVMVGIFTFEAAALSGAAVLMVAHGLSVAAMFLLLGMVEEASGRRGVDEFGGLAASMPFFAVLLVTAALATAALPGTANFVGEFLLLLGIFQDRPWIAAIAGLSTILTAVYVLRLLQRWLFGKPTGDLIIGDVPSRLAWAVVPLLIAAIGLGFYPRPISSAAAPALDALAKPARAAKSALHQPVEPAAATAAVPASEDAHVAR